MKKVFTIVLAVALLVTLVVPSVVLAKSPKTDFNVNGPHFNLNLVAKDKVMPGDYDNPDRHTMFIPLDTSSFTPFKTGNKAFSDPPDSMTGVRVNVTQGADWEVIDGNATDGVGAFQIAAGKWDVYIAVKAKKPHVSDAHTYIAGWIEAWDKMNTMWYYLKVGDVTVSKNGRWTDASTILWVSDAEDPFDIVTGDPMWVFDYMPLMDALTFGDSQDRFSDLAYLWQVDNHGNKLIQLRFYPHQNGNGG